MISSQTTPICTLLFHLERAIQTPDVAWGGTIKKKRDFYWDVGAVSSTLPLLRVFCTFNMNPTFALFDFLKNQIVTKFQHLGLFLWVGNELTQVVSHFAQMVVIKNMALSQSRHSELTDQCQAQHLNKLPWHCSHPCRIFNEQDDEWF